MERISLEVKGSMFEMLVGTVLTHGLPSSYVIFDVGVFSPFLNDQTQIDMVCVTNFGVYVIEAKGWEKFIKGSYNDRHWSGRGKGKVMTVFNTVNQNAIHVRALRLALYNQGIRELVQLHSIVVVPDSCQIITECKEVCHLNALCAVIKQLERKSSRIDRAMYVAGIKALC